MDPYTFDSHFADDINMENDYLTAVNEVSPNHFVFPGGNKPGPGGPNNPNPRPPVSPAPPIGRPPGRPEPPNNRPPGRPEPPNNRPPGRPEPPNNRPPGRPAPPIGRPPVTPVPPIGNVPGEPIYPGEKPTQRPPSYTPQRSPSLLKIDPGAIVNCQGSFTYVWLKNGRAFWMFPTYVGRRSISGFRWTQFGWTYFGIDLDRIESFTCSVY